MRLERRVERSAEIGYRYTAVISGDQGEYRAQIHGDRLRSAELLTPSGRRLLLTVRRRRGALSGPDGELRARFGGRRDLRVETGAAGFVVHAVGDGFAVWGDGGEVGRIVTEARATPPANCFEAHGRRMVPVRDWVLDVDHPAVSPDVWAALLIVVDDRRPTILLGGG